MFLGAAPVVIVGYGELAVGEADRVKTRCLFRLFFLEREGKGNQKQYEHETGTPVQNLSPITSKSLPAANARENVEHWPRGNPWLTV